MAATGDRIKLPLVWFVLLPVSLCTAQVGPLRPTPSPPAQGGFAAHPTYEQQVATAATAIPVSWREDADLHDVCFVDADFGWAVGGLGTIWHTRNGGENWELQPSPVTCTLEGVCFVDRQHGWAAGGYSLPYTHRSQGVVLETKDGGATWGPISGLLLPWLNAIHFVDKRQGLAVGDGTSLFPSGLFQTMDQGKTWSAVSGVSNHHWQGADLHGAGGVAVGQGGGVAWLRGADAFSCGILRPDGLGSRRATVAMLDPQTALLQQGNGLSITSDGGRTWANRGELPNRFGENFSLSTAEAAGASIWLAGSPGSHVARSVDGGGKWELVSTSVTLPIHGLCAVGAGKMAAVGARGMILKSSDDGQTWKVQRGGGKRSALLGIFADECNIPWHLLARASAFDEFRTHIVVLAPAHAEATSSEPYQAPLSRRLSEAAAEIGASAELLTELSLPHADLKLGAADVLRAWRERDANATAQLSKRLVTLVRTWKPEAIVTSDGSLGNNAGTSQLLSSLIVDVAEMAASDEPQPGHAETTVAPWKATRVLAATVPRDRPQRAKTSDLFVPARQIGLGVLTNRSQARASSSDRQPDSWTLLSLIPDGQGRFVDLGLNPMSGSVIPYDSAARRIRSVRDSSTSTDHRQTAQRRNQIQQALLAHARRNGSEQADGQLQAKLAQADRLLGGLSADHAGNMVYDLATAEIDRGDWVAGERLFRRFIAMHDQHDLSDAAVRWLVRYHTSAEVAWWREDAVAPNNVIQVASAELPLERWQLRANGEVRQTLGATPGRRSPLPLPEDQFERDATQDDAGEQESTESNIETPAIAPPSDATDADHDWTSGFQLAQQLKSKRPSLYADPTVLFPVAAISRATSQQLAAQSLYRRLLSQESSSLWGIRAANELAMLEGRPIRSDTAWPCPSIAEPPHLDGNLTDGCWTDITPHLLTHVPMWPGEPAPREFATRVWLARDAEFLYWAATCLKPVPRDYPPRRTPRPRDADLGPYDRLQLLLDVNRDYVSWWKLEVDHRGWTRDALHSYGDLVDWNPHYFVASTEDEQQWTIEVAIPLSELAPEALHECNWAIGVRRVIPQYWLEAWKTPYSADTLLPGILSLSR